MNGDFSRDAPPRRALARWLVYLLFLGLYLSLRGYHSFDGDQAYRLPLLLHQQNPQLYADDPFVRAFDEFNPHRGALLVLDLLARPLGLPAGLFVLFVCTFAATCKGVDSLAHSAWPEAGGPVGFLAIGLVLAAKAGNIGTNHLFEAMVLDRLIAFALGWLALASLVIGGGRAPWQAPAAIGLATLIHPSVGLQLAALLCACWVIWSLLGRWTQIQLRSAIRGIAGLIAAVLPGLAVNFPHGPSVESTMPAEMFWMLSVELQSPQHMVPHLWRMPQWLAWSSYVVLAGLACATRSGGRRSGAGDGQPEPRSSLSLRARTIPGTWPAPIVACRSAKGRPFAERRTTFREVMSGQILTKWSLWFRRHACSASAGRGDACTTMGNAISAQRPRRPVARVRLCVALLIILAGLALAWFFIEIRHNVRVTVFQPFRMATVARGIALLFVAGRVVALWQKATWLGRMRAILLGVGFIGDWLLVVVTLAEVAASIADAIRSRISVLRPLTFLSAAVWLGMLALGLNFLGHHDTEYGHIPLLSALGAGLVAAIWEQSRMRTRLGRSWPMEWTLRRSVAAFAVAWLVPLAALVAAAIPIGDDGSRSPLVASLLNRCRFIQVPVDDVERLAVWCRQNTPITARFIGPPGPKTFRLWSQRNLAFNRSASPYHAAGLGDWYARFQDHVDLHVAPAEFVQAYVKERHRFEARYQAMSETQRAALAVRQGATYIIAAAPGSSDRENQTLPAKWPCTIPGHGVPRRASSHSSSDVLRRAQSSRAWPSRNHEPPFSGGWGAYLLFPCRGSEPYLLPPCGGRSRWGVIRRVDEPGAGIAQSQPGPLELLHVEGRYAVYRLKPEALTQRQE